MKFSYALPLLSLLVPAYAQSESASASASESASASASAPAPSGSGGADQAYLEAVLGALTAANLTALVGVAQSIAGTAEGQALLGQLSQGNKTVFAPNDQAFSGVPEEISGNPQLLTQVLSYHILNNTYAGSGINVSPNHTIARTLLSGGDYALPGNRSAPLVLTRNSSDSEGFLILQASGNVSAENPAQAANLNVYVIDTVLSLPPSLADAAGTLFPSLAGVIQQSGLLDALAGAEGLTIFAPNDAALAAVADQLGQLSGNQTAVQTILANHVINGTVAYSDRLASGNYTSAAGSPFTFSMNETGTFVTSGNSTAQVVQSDIIYSGGVVHVIDGLLLNAESNPEAASSAYESATEAAATMTEPTQPVTATSGPAASGSGGAGGASGSASPSNAAGLTSGWNVSGLGLGVVVATVGVMLGGSAVFL